MCFKHLLPYALLLPIPVSHLPSRYERFLLVVASDTDTDTAADWVERFPHLRPRLCRPGILRRPAVRVLPGFGESQNLSNSISSFGQLG